MRFLERINALVARVEVPSDITITTWECHIANERVRAAKVQFALLTRDASREGDPGRHPIALGPADTYHQNFNFNFWETLTDEEIFTRMLKCMIFIRHHETQEWFRVDGKLWKDPHLGRNPAAGMLDYYPIASEFA